MMKYSIEISSFFISSIFLVVFVCCHYSISSQCNNYDAQQSNKVANYTLDVKLDQQEKIAYCTQQLVWKNISPDTIHEMRFYMYMNAFKDVKTSYLKDSDMEVFGQDLRARKPIEWGYIEIHKIEDDAGSDLKETEKFVRDLDGNNNDYSIVSYQLEVPILPGESKIFDLNFEVKLPKTIVRSGYGRNDYFLFVHWFPQACVYEANKYGEWGWNSHQFVPGTEFFADFGDYDVTIDAADHLVIGGSGCRVSREEKGGRQLVRFIGHDLIDFGWVAYPYFDTYTADFNGTEIEILMPPEHCAFAPRYLRAVEMGLEYLEKNVGPYPYPKITIVDPPIHTLNSGFMEYPMMITGASFYGIPSTIRTVESLVIHEFTHMYFMATLASNEKEEAWLDEGFVTYYEDRIMDHYYGAKKSIFDIGGFTSGNAENSRLEYTKLPMGQLSPIATPGWNIRNHYKGVIYAKTATMLKTFEGLIGRDVMDHIVKRYFEKHKFTHPKEADFIDVVKEELPKFDIPFVFNIDTFFHQVLHTTDYCDFAVENIDQDNHEISLVNHGGLSFPVDVVVTFSDGEKESFIWPAQQKKASFLFPKQGSIVAVELDPMKKIYLDINFINNSWTSTPNHRVITKYASKGTSWFQLLSHLSSFLM